MQEPFEKNPADSLPKDRRAIETVRRFMERSKKYREPHLELARRARELYESWSSIGKSVIGRANLKLPYGYFLIETELPQLTEIFLKEKPIFKFKGRTDDDMQWEDSLADFHSLQLDAMKFRPKFVSFCKALLIDGTAVAKVPYKYQEILTQHRVPTMDPLLGIQTFIKEPAIEVLFDGPDFEPIALIDFFPDWQVKSPGDVQSMRGCVHRTYKTLAELKRVEKRKGSDGREVGIYSNLDELEMSAATKGHDAWAEPWYEAQWDRLNDNKQGIKDAGKIEIWEYWGLYDPDGSGKLVEYVITIANGDVELRCEENFYDYKFKPFAASVNVPRDSEFYGISELIAVRGLIKEATAIRNARLDQVNLAVNSMWLADRAAGLNAKQIYSRPNGVIYTNDINGIKRLDPPEASASSYREIQEINNEIQQVTGSLGGPSLSEAGRVFGRSATGANLVKSMASSRIGVKARLMADLFFAPFARIMFMTNKQFVTDDQWVRVNDPDAPNPFAQLPASAFGGEYDFEIVTDFEVDSSTEIARLNAFIPIAQIAEQSQPGTINFDEVFKAYGRALFGRGIKKLTRTQDERMQMQAQNLAAQQMANAATGQAAPQPNLLPAGVPS